MWHILGLYWLPGTTPTVLFFGNFMQKWYMEVTAFAYTKIGLSIIALYADLSFTTINSTTVVVWQGGSLTVTDKSIRLSRSIDSPVNLCRGSAEGFKLFGSEPLALKASW